MSRKSCLIRLFKAIISHNLLYIMLLSAFLFRPALTYAGVVIGGTRVVYASNNADKSISVFSKEEKIPYLIQAWVDPFNKDDKTKAPFIVIPPVSRLEPAQEKILRIVHTKGLSLPEDRESVFWLNIKNIPPSASNKEANSLEIAVKTRIKLFWRPASIRMIPEDAAPKVKWHREGRNLIAENPNPIHISVMDVIVDGHDVPLNMIRPFETLTLPLPANSSGSQMTWRFINDYGAISEPLKQAL
ncbi:fimbrial chaperone [Escherichia coli]|uniref:long polar fimbrial chaperone LpfB-O113 n=1 Tax=Escherichia coli TaxID=562 RepID=UPI002433B96D|nr:long polar fimbrial chaperone LpfB-O113 [Escherichia coli]MDG5921764.1 fimbrial chaperone [Escherichia coli]